MGDRNETAADLRRATKALALELPAAVYDDYAPRVLALADDWPKIEAVLNAAVAVLDEPWFVVRSEATAHALDIAGRAYREAR